MERLALLLCLFGFSSSFMNAAEMKSSFKTESLVLGGGCFWCTEAAYELLPGVKDVVDNIKVSPVSGFDDRIRISALRAIYRDPVLGRYASDPAKPIRIVVDNGKLSLYGTVATAMDKQIAGMRANQVFGVFSVQNNLEVVKGS